MLFRSLEKMVGMLWPQDPGNAFVQLNDIFS